MRLACCRRARSPPAWITLRQQALGPPMLAFRRLAQTHDQVNLIYLINNFKREKSMIKSNMIKSNLFMVAEPT